MRLLKHYKETGQRTEEAFYEDGEELVWVKVALNWATLESRYVLEVFRAPKTARITAYYRKVALQPAWQSTMVIGGWNRPEEACEALRSNVSALASNWDETVASLKLEAIL